jgi:hypothetical protein
MNDKDYMRIDLNGLISVLTKEQFGFLIDAMVEEYTAMYGLEDIFIDEPTKPEYDCEDISTANSYLKKYML